MAYFGAFASVYDSFTENIDYKKRAEYILSLLEINGKNNGILLDVACGTGNLTEYLMLSDFDIIALDLSAEMLSEARNKLSGKGKDVLFLCQDMRELDLYGTVDCAVCTLDSLNHLIDVDDIRKAFSSIGLFMESGGIFVFDMNTVYKHKIVLSGNTFVYENDDAFLVWQNSDCDEQGIIDIMLDIFIADKNGRYLRESEDFSERAYDTDTVCVLLNEAGFSVKGIYADMSYSLPSEDEERVFFVAEKM